MAPTEYNYLIEKLPHRGPMRLIDTVLAIDERTVETETRIDESRADLFGVDGKVESYLGIELIAQSAALPLIFGASEDKEHAGVIVQVRSYSTPIGASIQCSKLRTICAVDLMLEGRVVSVKGSVYSGDRLVCEAVLTLAVQGDS